jgi:hypothetical protein
MVAVGDAENDYSFMRLAECPVAVNALASIKAVAAFVTAGSAGRQHWVAVDEAHRLLPRLWGHVPQRLNESLFVRYKSFYFRGPTGKHNLKAQNLNVFCQIAEGIGEETWMFHLRRNDYSRWMRDVIKNQEHSRRPLRTSRGSST